MAMIRNLKQQSYDNRFAVNEIIKKLFSLEQAKYEQYQKEKKDSLSPSSRTQYLRLNAYDLSMIVIAAALQYDADTYAKTYALLKQTIDSLKEKNHLSFYTGRLLFAAHIMNDSSAVKILQKELHELLHEEGITHDIYSALAEGYYASISLENYKKYRERLLYDIELLVRHHKREKHEAKESAQKNILADAIWSCIIGIQAAAASKNKADCLFLLDKIKQMTKESTIGDAISKTLPTEYFPAHALGILHFATMTIPNYKDPSIPLALEKSIKNAKDIFDQLEKQSKRAAHSVLTDPIAKQARYDEILGQLYFTLTKVKQEAKIAEEEKPRSCCVLL